MEKMGYARGLSSPSLLTLDRFPEIRRTRLTGFLTSAERSRQTPVKMTISAAIPTGAAEALLAHTPLPAGLKAMSSPTGFFSG
jgi:hypothetical protein